jgi:CRP-like cAMP-binding protein
MHPLAGFEKVDPAAPRPVAKLLECPRSTEDLLTHDATSLDFEPGGQVFRQFDPCRGLYLVVAGHFVRKAQRLGIRLTLGSCRPGDLVELAAALSDCRHTYTMTAVSQGSVMMLPIENLHRAFQSYPPLRMQLLEELAREVSRSYIAGCMVRRIKPRRQNPAEAVD